MLLAIVPDNRFYCFMFSNLWALTHNSQQNIKAPPVGKYTSQAEGGDVLQDTLHGSSFNTDDHHDCSVNFGTDSMMNVLWLHSLRLTSAALSCPFCVWGSVFPGCSCPVQILTQEDWNAVLYNGMASTTPLAALYFVALMTFGNYVLFNLLVAILVEGFQAEVRGKDAVMFEQLKEWGLALSAADKTRDATRE